jgi:hypothetical protein
LTKEQDESWRELRGEDNLCGGIGDIQEWKKKERIEKGE